MSCQCFSTPSAELVIAILIERIKQLAFILNDVCTVSDSFECLPFFEVELPPLAFLLLLFEVELTTLDTLPLELVLDIVVEDLDVF